MTDLRSKIEDIPSIGLEQTDMVKFMNRIDTKYVFPVTMVDSLLENLNGSYQILEIDGKRQFRYVTTYFDTPDFLFYRQHVTGKLGRYKIRVRSYETGGISFLEVKNKTNKGRTEKSRIKKNRDKAIDDDCGVDFLKEKVPVDTENIKPVLTNDFTRITIVNFQTAERITIDFNLSFTSDNGSFINLPFLAIAEIKHDKNSIMSPFGQAMKKSGIRETGFSKYCVGIALLYDVPKKNVIKPKVLLLNKIKDEYSAPIVL